MNDMTMEHGIAAVDLSGPIIDMFSKWLHAEPTHKPSHEESDRRFHARDFLDKHEDGQNPEGLPDADAIIVGPSRTMKTPTCRELASVHFMLVANVPLTTTELPLQLFLVPKHKVFVFVMSSAERLARYRTKRGQNGRLGSQYLDVNLIAQELNRARRLAEKNGWTIIDVAGQAPEELATEIIEILQSRNGCSE
jgi:regulator of PEP synthase PpsR (kinase-PPPase family)